MRCEYKNPPFELISGSVRWRINHRLAPRFFSGGPTKSAPRAHTKHTTGFFSLSIGAHDFFQFSCARGIFGRMMNGDKQEMISHAAESIRRDGAQSKTNYGPPPPERPPCSPLQLCCCDVLTRGPRKWPASAARDSHSALSNYGFRRDALFQENASTARRRFIPVWGIGMGQIIHFVPFHLLYFYFCKIIDFISFNWFRIWPYYATAWHLRGADCIYSVYGQPAPRVNFRSFDQCKVQAEIMVYSRGLKFIL
jgi:hypothetical protein